MLIPLVSACTSDLTFICNFANFILCFMNQLSIFKCSMTIGDPLLRLSFFLYWHSEISKAQDRLTDSLQNVHISHPQYRELLRMIMSTVGRGGEGDVGQRIRDEILVVQVDVICDLLFLFLLCTLYSLSLACEWMELYE